METITIDLPKMYGDHHVTDVRRILLAMPGVEDVYASSAFRVARARIDPAKISEADLRAKLEEAGYLGDQSIETEAWKTGRFLSSRRYKRMPLSSVIFSTFGTFSGLSGGYLSFETSCAKDVATNRVTSSRPATNSHCVCFFMVLVAPA